MKPEFSEFSYGYAVTEEVVLLGGATRLEAPLFPSLFQEGQPGGGWDVRIPTSGVPLFLQFKLSDYLEGSNAKERKSGLFRYPYYRMYIRPGKYSKQHEMLLALDSSGTSVFYIAPEFHKISELDSHYRTRSVVARSAAYSPRDIGPMVDEEEHYIVFDRGSSFGYLYSEDGRRVPKISLSQGLGPVLANRQKSVQKLGVLGLRKISYVMLDVVESALEARHLGEESIDVGRLRNIAEEHNPFALVSYLARTFFDAEFFVMEKILIRD